MKRFLVALTALVASLAIGLATVSTTAGASGGDQVATQSAKKKKKKKIPSFISLTVAVTDPTPPTTYSPGTPGSGSFSGQVTSRKAKCVSARVVTILRAGVPVAQTTTQVTGSYSVNVASRPPGGSYTAFTPKKVIKKKNKKTGKTKRIICKPATSPAVNVP
jgi:hypothetical protein